MWWGHFIILRLLLKRLSHPQIFSLVFEATRCKCRQTSTILTMYEAQDALAETVRQKPLSFMLSGESDKELPHIFHAANSKRVSMSDMLINVGDCLDGLSQMSGVAGANASLSHRYSYKAKSLAVPCQTIFVSTCTTKALSSHHLSSWKRSFYWCHVNITLHLHLYYLYSSTYPCQT